MPRKGEPRKSRVEIEERRARIVKLYCRGMSQYAIAREVDLNQSEVCRELEKASEEWRTRYAGEIQEHKQTELKRVDDLSYFYWIKFEDSEKPIKREVKSAGSGNGKDSKRGTIYTEEQTGDPRYLTGVQWCIEKRCKILGLDAPAKAEFKFQHLTDEQLIEAAEEILGDTTRIP